MTCTRRMMSQPQRRRALVYRQAAGTGAARWGRGPSIGKELREAASACGAATEVRSRLGGHGDQGPKAAAAINGSLPPRRSRSASVASLRSTLGAGSRSAVFLGTGTGGSAVDEMVH